MNKPPCKPDCPRRSATCHADCSDYAIYAAGQAAQRKARHERVEATADIMAAQKNVAARYHRKHKK